MSKERVDKRVSIQVVNAHFFILGKGCSKLRKSSACYSSVPLIAYNSALVPTGKDYSTNHKQAPIFTYPSCQ